MPPLNQNYNPMSVTVRNPVGPIGVKGTIQAPYTTGGQQAPAPSNVIGAQSVRASGSGPFDSAYRQNLATYAGGLFSRPGGNLSFNPTGNLSDLGGQALGGGNAPIFGGPQSLLNMALGGSPASTPNNQNAPTSPASYTGPSGWQQWLNQFGRFLGNTGAGRFLGA